MAIFRDGAKLLKGKVSIVLLIIVAYLVVGFVTMPDYGLTWDEALGHLFVGERILYFYLSGMQAKYLDVEHRQLGFYQYGVHPDLYQSQWRKEGYWLFYPVTNTLSAVSCLFFYRLLHIMDPIDAHHYILFILVAVAMCFVYFLAKESYGKVAAIIAVLVLATYPRFFGHVHNNLKDVGVTCFMTMTIISFWRSSLRFDWRWAILAGITFGLGLGSKLNAVFLPVILMPWFILVIAKDLYKSRLVPLSWSISLLFMPIIAILIVFLSWPIIWQDWLTYLYKFFHHYLNLGLKGPDHWQSRPLKQIFFSMPPTVLILFITGFMYSAMVFRQEQFKTFLLLFLWIAIPILKVSIPGAHSYNGIRQFLEIFPAIAIIAGIGGQAIIGGIWKLLARFLSKLPEAKNQTIKKLITSIIILLFILPIVWQDVRYHPYQTCYFNCFIGGLGGAQQRDFPDSMDYWCNSYRQGFHWLNKNAESQSLLMVPVAYHIMFVIPPRWLRADIEKFGSWKKEHQVLAQKRPFYFLWPQRLSTGKNRIKETFVQQCSEVVHEIKVADGSVLKIYKKNDIPSSPKSLPAFVKVSFKEEPADKIKTQFTIDPEQGIAKWWHYNLEEVSYKNGIYQFKSTPGHPEFHIILKEPVLLREIGDKLEIKIRIFDTQTWYSDFRLYWQYSDELHFSEKYSTNFPIPHDGQRRIYTINLDKLPGWDFNKKLKAIRFDPVEAGPAQIELENIRFYSLKK